MPAVVSRTPPSLRLAAGLCGAFLGVHPPALNAQEATVPSEVVAWLQEHAEPIAGPAEEGSAEVFRRLVAGYDVVGLGEGTHGTREFYQLKSGVLQAMARAGTLAAVLWESDIAPLTAIDRALGDPGASAVAANARFRGYPWKVESMVELLEALQAHNAGHRGAPVRFAGIDIFDVAGALEITLPALRAADDGEARQVIACLAQELVPEATAVPADSVLGARFDALPPSRMPALAACADWATEVLERTGADWSVQLAARSVAQRTRHLHQFVQILPIMNPASFDDAVGQWSALVAGSRRAAGLLTGQLEALGYGAESRIGMAIARFGDPRALRTAYQAEMTAGDRHELGEAVAEVAARAAARAPWWQAAHAGIDADALLAAADTLHRYLDALHEATRRHSERTLLNVREVSLAENVVAASRAVGTGGGVVYSAHNFHVNRAAGPEGGETAGSLLAARLGAAYLSIGTMFGSGSVLAIDRSASGSEGTVLRVSTVPPPPAGSWDAALLTVPHRAFVLDLRQLPDTGVVAAWFGVARPMRWIGNSYDPGASEAHWFTTRLAEQFDAVIFVREAGASRPTARSRELYRVVEQDGGG